MSDRPTPITDEIDTNQKSRSWESSYWNMRDHARDLERQLAEVREENARLQKSLSNASAIYDAAREQRDHYIAESNQLAEELKQERGVSFREQRDMLAEALPVAMARAYASGYQHGHEDTVETQFIPVHHTDTKDYFADNIRQMMIDGSQPEATEALAAVEGGNP